jgi:signal transduction histidine kinase
MARLRDPRLIDGLLAVALAAVLQLQLALRDHPGNAWLNSAGGLLLTLPLAVRRTQPFAVALTYTATAALTALLGSGLFTGEPPAFACLVAGAVTFYSLGAHAEDRPALAGAAAGVAGLWICVIASDHRDIQSFLFSGGLIVATPWLFGRNHRSRLQRLALREDEALQRERVAVGEERARIARELHDVVAHSVGGMVAQAQGARRMLDRDPERAREALEAIERTGRNALDEMRRSLGVLRRTDADVPLAPQPGMDGLPNLLEEARASGLEVALVTEGEPAPLPAGVDLSAYRIVQEALTNARKHGGPVRTRVTVRYGRAAIELEIADDGMPGRAPTAHAGAKGSSGVLTSGAASNGGGQGLVGMRERVALYGGELDARPRPEGGFVVRASLPLEP